MFRGLTISISRLNIYKSQSPIFYMKKGVFIFGAIFLMLISLASADIILIQQPEDTYSMGDVINLPIKLTTLSSLNDFFALTILCNGQESQVHKEFISLSPGEEKQINSQIPLILSFTGRSTASCSLKASVGEVYLITNDFSISNSIIITLKEGRVAFNPGEDIIIEGDAKKANTKFVDGFVDLTLQAEGLEPISISDTVKNGYFFANFSLPENTPAAKYSVAISIYEKDFQGQLTNQGTASHLITINQVPTNLELILKNPEVEPGTPLNIIAILHDQTGESIKATATIIIEDGEGNILDQVDRTTDENYGFPIEYNEVPDTWFVSATSGILEAEAEFNILAKEAVSVELVNKTLIVKNIGNVVYNKSILVKIGTQPVNFETNLKVGEKKKYILEAPDGEYNIEVSTSEGDLVEESMFLTGKAIDVRESGLSIGRFFTNPVVWIFLILILAFVAFIIFRKGLKRTFLGYKPKFFKKKSDDSIPTSFGKKSESLISPRSPAQLSLSIKGEKQNSVVTSLILKNAKDLQSSNANEPLQKIVDLAESQKAATYENQDNIFFIFAPLKTKTFKNEKTAIVFAQQAKELLEKHNKLAKQKIDFGISVNYGAIVAKHEGPILKFMSMGTLITSSKKISSLADREVLLSKQIRERSMIFVSSDKKVKDGIEVFTIKEIKAEKAENKKFIHKFVEKYEKENAEKAKK